MQPRLHVTILVGAVAVVLAMKIRLLWSINVNWDEFLYLSRVYDFMRGDLAPAFQSFHVQLFRWLPSLAGHEVDKVIAGRTAMYPLRVVTCVCVFLIARRLYGSTGAWFAVFSSLAVSYLLRHGEAFRADPMIAALAMMAIALLLLKLPSRTAVATAATALAVATLVSVKAVFFAPTVAALFAVASLDERARPMILRRLLLFCTTAAVAYAGLYALHAASLAPDSASTITRIGSIAPRMLETPAIATLATTLRTDWAFWMLAAGGFAIAAYDAVAGPADARRRGMLVVAMALPLVSLLVYRNAFPYFYILLIPMASLACGLVAARVESALKFRPRLAAATIVAMAVPGMTVAATFYILHPDDATAEQRQVLNGIHEMFPEPMPYIDRGGMVASFPRVGPFMSTFVLAGYRERQTPVFPALVAERQPVFVLANVAGLELWRSWDEMDGSPHRLLRADFEYLNANYIHHWGPVWVAGAQMTVDDGDAGTAFDLAVSGPYTIEADRNVTINGQRYANGDVVELAAGSHRIVAPGGPARVTLRYGEVLGRPAFDPPEGPLFWGLR